jgi:hypothetical protein
MCLEVERLRSLSGCKIYLRSLAWSISTPLRPEFTTATERKENGIVTFQESRDMEEYYSLTVCISSDEVAARDACPDSVIPVQQGWRIK